LIQPRSMLSSYFEGQQQERRFQGGGRWLQGGGVISGGPGAILEAGGDNGVGCDFRGAGGDLGPSPCYNVRGKHWHGRITPALLTSFFPYCCAKREGSKQRNTAWRKETAEAHVTYLYLCHSLTFLFAQVSIISISFSFFRRQKTASRRRRRTSRRRPRSPKWRRRLWSCPSRTICTASCRTTSSTCPWRTR